jgi:cysteinyl-tRNA synthetase
MTLTPKTRLASLALFASLAACNLQVTPPDTTSSEPAPVSASPVASGGHTSGGSGGSTVGGGDPTTEHVPGTRGFPEGSTTWGSFYGPIAAGDIDEIASKFRVINLDADPDAANVTDEQIAALRAGGKNRVISYLDVGSCETYRSYYAKCEETGALTTVYSAEYPDEKWANLSNAKYQSLIVDVIAPALAARGVDGFFLDNMEVVEHGADAESGPCDEACAQGGLDLVHALRQKFPDKLIVMQNATSEVTRLGKTHGVDYPSLLDGITHEETYTDDVAQTELRAWKKMNLTVAGKPFFIGIEDYVGACTAATKPAAEAIFAKAAADGFVAYVTDASAQQQKPCFWDDL